MRRIILSALLITLTFCTVFSQNDNICRLGITYEISNNKNWGLNYPVILNVIPYSPAELVGLKQNDIITSIEGINALDLTPTEIQQLLNSIDKPNVQISVRNIRENDKHVVLRKECKSINAITEEQLSTAFAMYSLESNSDREFVCPFKTTVTADTIDFGKFKTFAFSPIDENNRELETAINEYIEEGLAKKGLTVDVNQPDLLIQTFYFFDKNPNYKGRNKILIKSLNTYRFDISQNKMIEVPFLNWTASESEAEYLLQFGFRLIDQKFIPGRTLWECESNELMESSFSLKKYAHIHVPLMCMQYPYAKNRKNATYSISQRTFNYTGISLDIDNLSSVVQIDNNSPAHSAGIRPNDKITAINHLPLKYSADEYSAAYKGFITNTFKYRNPKTQFTDINGFKRCMYWDSFKYTQVSEAIRKNGNKAVFSYLFYYAPYINPSGNNACTFDIIRDDKKQQIVVRPSIRRNTSILIK